MYAIFRYGQTDINDLTFFNVFLTKNICTCGTKQIPLWCSINKTNNLFTLKTKEL